MREFPKAKQPASVRQACQHGMISTTVRLTKLEIYPHHHGASTKMRLITREPRFRRSCLPGCWWFVVGLVSPPSCVANNSSTRTRMTDEDEKVRRG